MNTQSERATWSSIDWRPFVDVMRDAKRVVICAHIRPDGDTLGSSIAMARALQKLGKEALVVDSYPVPPALRFLDPEGRVAQLGALSPEQSAFVESADLVMAIDVSSAAQLGPEATQLFSNFQGPSVAIDHHEVGDPLGKFRFVDPDADSSGSLVFEAIEALGVQWTRELAFPVYTAIATDTGMFRFASTNSGTFRRAAVLVDAGVRVDEVYRLTNEQESFGRFKLLGTVASTCERFIDGKGVFMRLTQEDFQRAGAIASDSEDLVNEALSVAGTEVATIAIEQPDGSVKASFRSRCAMNCALLAKSFNGGGHQKAAGATLKLPFEEACRRFMEGTEARYHLDCGK